MFRHQGKTRTHKHNQQIAIVLSFVAGIVNVSGFLAIQQFTTNVTGHFALFMYDVANFDFWKGSVYFLYIFSFLFGSFTSSFLIEKFRENKKLNIYTIPTFIEVFLLLFVALSTHYKLVVNINLIACILLFAMGLQNSFVSKISKAVVRTTHLTGLFTDLGIELSQIFFLKTNPERAKLKRDIKLHFFIIWFFFLGGISGGILYSYYDMKLNSLIIAAILLLFSLFYDDFRFRFIKAKRKFM